MTTATAAISKHSPAMALQLRNEVLIPSLDDICADFPARGQQANMAVLPPGAQGDWVEGSRLPLVVWYCWNALHLDPKGQGASLGIWVSQFGTAQTPGKGQVHK